MGILKGDLSFEKIWKILRNMKGKRMKDFLKKVIAILMVLVIVYGIGLVITLLEGKDFVFSFIFFVALLSTMIVATGITFLISIILEWADII